MQAFCRRQKKRSLDEAIKLKLVLSHRRPTQILLCEKNLFASGKDRLKREAELSGPLLLSKQASFAVEAPAIAAQSSAFAQSAVARNH
jgi:hypothetical protein